LWKMRGHILLRKNRTSKNNLGKSYLGKSYLGKKSLRDYEVFCPFICNSKRPGLPMIL
jgi:hypothetical protein